MKMDSAALLVRMMKEKIGEICIHRGVYERSVTEKRITGVVASETVDGRAAVFFVLDDLSLAAPGECLFVTERIKEPGFIGGISKTTPAGQSVAGDGDQS